METLKAESRKVGVKSRQLRRNNFVPAVLYGKHLDQSRHLKLSLKETEQFLKTNFVGSRAEIVFGDETHVVMLKELTREPATGKIEHLSFMALQKGEKVRGVVRVFITGREALQRKGVVIQTLTEINYRALPSKLVDSVTINVENLEVNENIKVSDLELANDPDIELLTGEDSVIVTVTPLRTFEEPVTTDEDVADAETDDETDADAETDDSGEQQESENE